MKYVVNAFAVLLLLLVGTVFVTTPTELLYMMLNSKLALGIIVLYYILATLLPIDKRIGRLYPYFGALLLISALSVDIGIVSTAAPIPEISLSNFIRIMHQFFL
jgi:carbon starvation protein CstA